MNTTEFHDPIAVAPAEIPNHELRPFTKRELDGQLDESLHAVADIGKVAMAIVGLAIVAVLVLGWLA